VPNHEVYNHLSKFSWNFSHTAAIIASVSVYPSFAIASFAWLFYKWHIANQFIFHERTPYMKPNRQRKPRPDKGERHEKPLSLSPLTFSQAIDKLIKAKPKSDQKDKPKPKR